MTKLKEKTATISTVSFNSVHDYITFSVLILLILGTLVGFYLYNVQTQVFGVWAKQFYSWILN